MCDSFDSFPWATKTSREQDVQSIRSSDQQHRKGITGGAPWLNAIQSHPQRHGIKLVHRRTKRRSYCTMRISQALSSQHVTNRNNIKLNVTWVPREQNEEADFWSRVRDFDDWGICPTWCLKICQYFKVEATVDRFADNRNKKLPRFNSRFYHQNSEAVDSFTQDWSNEVNWVVPPIYLINRVLDYARLSKAELVLVFPLWKSATFWPKIQGLLSERDPALLNSIEMGNIFVKGTTESSIFNPQNWKGKTLALHLRF